MPGGPRRRSAGAKTKSIRAAATSSDHRVEFDGTGIGSRSVIVRGGQNPSRAPSASASPQTLD